MTFPVRVKFTANSSGTADFVVPGSAPAGFYLPSAQLNNGDYASYVAASADLSQVEWGVGHYSGAVSWTIQAASYQHGSGQTVNAPSGLTAGDLIIVAMAGTASSGTPTFTVPSGFTGYYDASTDGTTAIAVGWKIAGASEPTSYTFGVGNISTSGLYSFRTSLSGADPATVSVFASTVSHVRNYAGGTSFSFPTPSVPSNTLVFDAITTNPGLSSPTLPSGPVALDTGGDGQASWVSVESTTVPTRTITNSATIFNLSYVQLAFTASPTASLVRDLPVGPTGSKINFSTAPNLALMPIGGELGDDAPVTITGNYTLALTDRTIIGQGTGAITLTLPDPTRLKGQQITVVTEAAFAINSASSNVVPRAGGAAGTAIVAGTAGSWADLKSNGTAWVAIRGS